MAVTHHAIDPDGDVLLKLRSKPAANVPPPSKKPRTSHKSKSRQIEVPALVENEVHMLVSSKYLTSVSPVFKAMLRNGAFQEGQSLNATGKVSIPLSDDDPDAMKVMLDILHHRTRQVPKEIDLETMTYLAILGDKYQMTEILEPYSSLWLAEDTPLTDTLPSEYDDANFLPWLAIAWVFKLPDAFTNLTALAIKQSVSNNHDDDITFQGQDLPIPITVLEKIQNTRQKILHSATSILRSAIQKMSSPDVHCRSMEYPIEYRDRKRAACDSMHLGSLIRAATAAKLWPTPEPPYENMSWETVSVAIQDMSITTFCESPLSGSSYSSHQSSHVSLLRQLHQIGLSSAGLPLEFEPKKRTSRRSTH